MNFLLRLLGLDEASLREERISQLRKKLIAADTVDQRMHYWRQICVERKKQEGCGG